MQATVRSDIGVTLVRRRVTALNEEMSNAEQVPATGVGAATARPRPPASARTI